MFKSKVRPIVIPQYEHGRQSGLLAAQWGNERFDRPAVDFESFVKGVTFHDRGYGTLDNAAIGATDDAVWLEIVQQGIDQAYDDAAADILVLMHIRRLLGWQSSPERQQYGEMVEQRIQARLPETPYRLEQLRWADRITSFCDKISFDFCMGAAAELTRKMYPRVDDFDTIVEVTQRIDGALITVDPWPFRIARIESWIVGYEAEGYPARLEPVRVPFRVEPG